MSADPRTITQGVTTGTSHGSTTYKMSQRKYDLMKRTRAKGQTAPTIKSIAPISDPLVAGYQAMTGPKMGAQNVAPIQPPTPPSMPVIQPPPPQGGATAPFTGSVQGDAYRKQMATAILKGIGADPTESNMAFMLAWMQAEGTQAQFNPLATTQTMQGATNFNDHGVKNYPNQQIGINATINTLLNGRYNQIIRGLRHSVDPLKLASSPQLETWGTGGLIKQVLLSSMGGK